MQTIVDLKLDNELNLVHTLRVCEGVEFNVKMGANTQIRVRALKKRLDAGEIEVMDYYIGILEITCGKEAADNFMSKDPSRPVFMKVMNKIYEMMNTFNNPEVAAIEGIDEKN